MYSFMALIMVIVVGVTAGISYLIADYFFKTNEQELAEKGNEMAATVEYFMEFDNSRDTLNRYVAEPLCFCRGPACRRAHLAV